ncbi:MAG: two-component system response regulator CreB [Victivallales bacterium]|nr:two-component system response regulator CreB [Victivallales bacterium]
MKQRILIIEDEVSIADTVKYVLEQALFEVFCTTTAGEGERLLRQCKPDLLVLDIGLPDMNGLDFYRKLRNEFDLPVIFLTACSDEIDRIVGLELGADDYVTKPFSPRELAARVKTVLRRFAFANAPALKRVAEFELSEERRSISWHGEKLKLSRNEYALLVALLNHPGRVYSRRQLMEIAWEEPEASMERTVDTHIKTIRAKLKTINKDDPIVTHRGFGYSIS